MNKLQKQHRQMLIEGSGLHDGIIKDRKYETVTDPEYLKELGFSPEQAARVPTLLIPLYGVDGGKEPIGYQSRPDEPRIKNGKPLKYETAAGWQMRLDVFPSDSLIKQLKDPGIALWITEGVKKGDCAWMRGLCCISLIGVWNWRGTNSQGGSTELADWDAIAIKGRTIYIAFDNDVMTKPAVQKALRRLAGMLRRRGAKKVIAVIPEIPGHEGKMGLDDFLIHPQGSVFALMQCADPEMLSEKAIQVNGRNLADVGGDALAAIVEGNVPPTVYVRDGKLVRVVTNERDISAIQELSEGALRRVMSQTATFVKAGKSDTTEVFPPKDVVDEILSMESWPGIPPIIAVTKAPVLARSGHLSLMPGYCPESQFYVATKQPPPVFDGTVQEAVKFIFEEVLGDFLFTSNADRAHALALMLFTMVRPAFDGPSPLHMIEAPERGSGKSKLARICLMPTAGDNISGTPGTKDEEEWRKKITAVLLSGQSYVLLDNLTEKLQSASLDNVLTSTEWQDRVLQQTRMIKLPNFSVWVATANNAELSRDITDRTLSIFIDTGTEHPRERSGPTPGTTWRHTNLEGWITQNRPLIVSALCKIVTHWVDEGKPEYKGSLMGSFEGWRKTIGGILGAAGVDGFLGNIQVLRDRVDEEHVAWSSFMYRWFSTYGSESTKAGDLLEMFQQDDYLCGTLEGKGAAKLSHQLKKKAGSIMGSIKLVRAAVKYGGSWCYKAVPQPGFVPPVDSESVNETDGEVIV